MRVVIAAALLALAACNTLPPPAASPTPPDTPAVAVYRLRGEVASLLAEGKLSGSEAIALNHDLQLAQAELSIGDATDAQKLIDSVKGQLQ